MWATARSVAGTSAELLPPLAALQLRVLVGDVGDAQRVVLQLVSIELLDGSEAEASLHKMKRVFGANDCNQCKF